MPRDSRFTPVADPDVALLAQVRARFEAGELTLQAAANELGLTRSTLSKRIRGQWLWRLPPRLAKKSTGRKTSAPRKTVAPAKSSPTKASRSKGAKPATQVDLSRDELSPEVLHRRLMVQIARLMRAIEANIDENGLPIDAERHGKLLSIVMKQQADAARLEDQAAIAKRERQTHASDAASAADAPIDLARLRADLARRLAGNPQSGPAEPGPEEL